MKYVFCKRKQKKLPALAKPPYPGEIGEKIFQNISQEGWEEWQAHQVKLINEFRLRPSDKKAKKFILEEMQRFLFEGKAHEIPDFKPTSDD